jgi:hypothetical protein
VAYTNEQAVEVVGELVERCDGVPGFGVRVGVAVADVVRDRVDYEQTDAAEVESVLAQPVDVVWQLGMLLNDVASVEVRARGCNLAAGANKANGRRRPEPYVQLPYRWSRRWFDDPPVGTGNGDWQPIDNR